jgi:hypothetical protein
MITLSTEEKIQILRLALESTDLYNDRVYKLQEYSYGLLNDILCGEAKCKDASASAKDIEELIEGFNLMIYKYENYRAVVSQLKKN